MNSKFDALFDEPVRDANPGPALTGTMVGGYLIGDCLASQMTSQVYLAEDQRLRRRVAIKVLRHGEWLTRDSLARFQAEGRVLAQLRHPNIVSIFACYNLRDNPCIVMEYMGGGTLAEHIGQPFAPLEAARILLRIARGAADAHIKGIVHRDLKPQNILLDRSIREPALETSLGFLKISDFGIAKIMNDFEGFTRSGMQPGTISHMAPEQIDPEIGAITPATDVFALGTLLFQLLTGENPFFQRSVAQTLRNIVEQPVPLAGSRVSSVPDWLEAICDKCLQKTPSRRFPNADQLACEIERWLQPDSIRIRSVEQTEEAETTPTDNRKNWMMTTMFVITVILLFCIALFKLRESLFH